MNVLCGFTVSASLLLTAAATSPQTRTIQLHIPADAPEGLAAVIRVPCAAVPSEPGSSEKPAWRAVGGAVPPGTPVQFVADLDLDGKPRSGEFAWLPITVAPGQRGRTLEVPLEAAPPPARDGVRLAVKADQATDFMDGERLVLRYNHGPRDLDGKNDPNAVLGFIHPIIGLDGETLTQNQPADHLHHRGLFWAWPRLERNGATLGNWWERKDMRYRPGKVFRREAGPVLATMTAEGFWDYQTKDMPAPERVVREVVTIRVFAEAATRAAGYQAFDIDLDFFALVDGLRMAGTKTLNKGYGGLTFRWPKPPHVRIVADTKELEKDGLLYHAVWADCSGDFPAPQRKHPGTESGVAILTDPDHPGSPPPWLFRFYGVLNVSYPGLEYVSLRRDKPLRLHYRLILHRGSARDARIADIYKLYAARWTASPSPDTP